MFDGPKEFRLCIALGCGFAASLLTPLTAPANGGKSKSAYKLVGKVPIGGEDCLFSAQIDPLLFSLTTIAQKYHVIRVECMNDTRKDLKLSDTMDAATLFTDGSGEQVDAVVDLAKIDPVTWESIPKELREKIVYPELVESGEEEDLILFIPVQGVKGAPERLLLQINSLDEEILLTDPKARRARR